MRRNWFLVLGLAATTALGGSLAIPALAHGPGDGRGYERGHEARGMGERGMMHGEHGEHGSMMGMMERMHGRGMGGMMGGHGMMGGMGPMSGGMMGDMMEAFDADEDGTLTPDELRAGLESRLSEYDADGSGTLSIDEFEALHSAMIREHMVDRFQFLDNDGDGEVTAEEIAVPADRMERMEQMRERMMGSAPGSQPGQGAGMMQDDDGMGRGMMQGDGMMPGNSPNR